MSAWRAASNPHHAAVAAIKGRGFAGQANTAVAAVAVVVEILQLLHFAAGNIVSESTLIGGTGAASIKRLSLTGVYADTCGDERERPRALGAGPQPLHANTMTATKPSNHRHQETQKKKKGERKSNGGRPSRNLETTKNNDNNGEPTYSAGLAFTSRRWMLCLVMFSSCDDGDDDNPNDTCPATIQNTARLPAENHNNAAAAAKHWKTHRFPRAAT